MGSPWQSGTTKPSCSSENHNVRPTLAEAHTCKTTKATGAGLKDPTHSQTALWTVVPYRAKDLTKLFLFITPLLIDTLGVTSAEDEQSTAKLNPLEDVLDVNVTIAMTARVG